MPDNVAPAKVKRPRIPIRPENYPAAWQLLINKVLSSPNEVVVRNLKEAEVKKMKWRFYQYVRSLRHYAPGHPDLEAQLASAQGVSCTVDKAAGTITFFSRDRTNEATAIMEAINGTPG